MGRLWRSLVVALGLVAVTALPARGAPSPVAGDSVTGTGTVTNSLILPIADISVNAQSDPVGGNPTGAVSFVLQVDGTDFPVSGTVTCLAVDGNRAFIGFENAAFGSSSVLVVDNAGSIPPAPDQFLFRPFTSGCSDDPGAFLDGGPLATGDLVVQDAHPFPTDKDQCKLGGWRNLTDDRGDPFRNQGKCIAFVNRVT